MGTRGTETLGYRLALLYLADPASPTQTQHTTVVT